MLHATALSQLLRIIWEAGMVQRTRSLVRRPWQKVVFAADCDEDGNCPVCGIEYADCDCPGPTMDGYDYVERQGELYARKQVRMKA
jgi:hypothetical protein